MTELSKKKKKPKLTPEQTRAWLDWAIPFEPQNPNWHKAEEGMVGLKRYLLSQMILVSEGEDLRENLQKAKKADVDLNLIAEEALLLEKKDLFFTLAHLLKIKWNAWPRAQINERNDFRKTIKNLPLNFEKDVKERFEHPTMMHLLIAKQPHWINDVIKKGWNPAESFKIEGSSLKDDLAICRAWMENDFQLMDELWDNPLVHSNQDNKDTLLNVIVFFPKQKATEIQDLKTSWIVKLLESGANPNRDSLVKENTMPAGLRLIHNSLSNMSVGKDLFDANFLKLIEPSKWKPIDFMGGLFNLISYRMKNGSRYEIKLIESFLQKAIEIPQITPYHLEDKVIENMFDGNFEIGTWYLSQGYRLSLNRVIEKYSEYVTKFGHQKINIRNPLDSFNPGFKIKEASWSLIGGMMSEEDEESWTKLASELKNSTPPFNEKEGASYKITREQANVWYDKVKLQIATFSKVDHSFMNSKKRI